MLNRETYNCYLEEFSAENGVSRLLGDLDGLHFGLDIECDSTVTRDFDVLFQRRVEVSGAVSVPEERNVTKLNSLTAQQ